MALSRPAGRYRIVASAAGGPTRITGNHAIAALVSDITSNARPAVIATAGSHSAIATSQSFSPSTKSSAGRSQAGRPAAPALQRIQGDAPEVAENQKAGAESEQNREGKQCQARAEREAVASAEQSGERRKQQEDGQPLERGPHHHSPEPSRVAERSGKTVRNITHG